MTGVIFSTTMVLVIISSQRLRREPSSKVVTILRRRQWDSTLSNFLELHSLSRSIRISARGPTESCQLVNMENGKTSTIIVNGSLTPIIIAIVGQVSCAGHPRILKAVCSLRESRLWLVLVTLTSRMAWISAYGVALRACPKTGLQCTQLMVILWSCPN